jgi:hypothetical protein
MRYHHIAQKGIIIKVLNKNIYVSNYYSSRYQ